MWKYGLKHKKQHFSNFSEAQFLASGKVVGHNINVNYIFLETKEIIEIKKRKGNNEKQNKIATPATLLTSILLKYH